MNTDYTLTPDHQLVELIEKWFVEHGDLKHGEGIVVSISRISTPVNVTIRRSYPEVMELIKEAARETRFGSISNMIDSWGDDPKTVVDRLYHISTEDLLRHRNVGKVGLQRFVKALQKKEIRCRWF